MTMKAKKTVAKKPAATKKSGAAKKEPAVKTGKKLHEGKAKIVYASPYKDKLILFFKDDATAFNAKKKGTIINKGIINAALTAHLYPMLEKKGIPTHFIKTLDPRRMLVRKTKIIPLEVVVRNIAAGSLAKRMGIAEGTKVKFPIIEFYYKDDALDDPMVNEDHIAAFNLATQKQVQTLRDLAKKVNSILVPYFKRHKIDLVDYKLEFGVAGSKIYLADELSPDSCRLWDSATHEKLDKDRFRRDMGKIEEAYIEVFERLTGEKFTPEN